MSRKKSPWAAISKKTKPLQKINWDCDLDEPVYPTKIMPVEVTESSGCVWYDLKLPCRDDHCKVCQK